MAVLPAYEPGDEYLMAPLEVSRLCPDCSRWTTHRQRFDAAWGRVYLICLRCGGKRRATIIGGEWRNNLH